MKKILKNIHTFEQHSSESINRTNAGKTSILPQSKHLKGDIVETKENIDDILNTRQPYPVNDNSGIEDYLGKKCIIEYVVYDDEYNYYRYLIDIDNGDYWWIDECFN